MLVSVALFEFQKFAEEFAAEHLDQYVIEMKRRGGNPSRKEINDPLWGTISLSGAEVAVLDSPLLQRLRLIRQLGVVHWVYPGAIHTRFEHTLGVVRQVQYLSAAINELGVQEGLQELIPQDKVNLLRLAALLHDIGHAAFSHVSERALEDLQALSSVPIEFEKIHRAENRSLSEIFAYFVAKSPSMREFLKTIIAHDNDYIRLNKAQNANLEEIVESVSRAIIGRSVDDRLPLLHEIISGPFDADKLDYFVRDARNAGTPSLLDISRLIQKIALREFDATELPGGTGRDIVVQKRHVLVGIKWSGISILDELHLSRVLLYAKIYRHPKVVAIEQMVRSALLMLAKAVGATAVLRLIYRHSDDALLAMSVTALAEAISIDLDKASQEIADRVGKAAAILADLRMRRLTSKAFQLQRTYPGSNQTQDETQKHGLISFREILEHPIDSENFKNTLILEVKLILKMLNAPNRSDIDLEGSILLRAIGATPGGSQIGRAYLITKTGVPIRFKDYTVNRTAWADSYLSDQPSGYIFADDDIADVTYVAIEVLLRKSHNISLPPSALEMSKRDERRIRKMKLELKAAGYYNESPFDLRPEPSRLSHADIAACIAKFTPVFDAYQAPISNLGEKNRQNNIKMSAKNWLHQFDNNENIECATRILDNIKMISRVDTVDAVVSFIKNNQNFMKSIVVPFGSARDSGAIHGYFAADLRGTFIDDCLTLEEAFQKRAGRPIIFLDDFLGSGGQSRDILAAGFGRSDLRAALSEERDLFSADIQAFLRGSPLAFVFTAAWDDGMAELKKMVAELHLDATVFRHIDENGIPFLDGALAGLPQSQITEFLNYSKYIGKTLLRTQSKKKIEENDVVYEDRINGRVLGYGNRGMLLASPFNVPTQTFTPIWASGDIGGATWKALLPRRKKA